MAKVQLYMAARELSRGSLSADPESFQKPLGSRCQRLGGARVQGQDLEQIDCENLGRPGRVCVPGHRFQRGLRLDAPTTSPARRGRPPGSRARPLTPVSCLLR